MTSRGEKLIAVNICMKHIERNRGQNYYRKAYIIYKLKMDIDQNGDEI